MSLTSAAHRPTVQDIVSALEDRSRVASVDRVALGTESTATADGAGEPSLRARLERHVPADAKEAGDLTEMLAFLDRHPDPFDRDILEGHFTGSAVVVSAAGDRVLLLHHRKLDRWLQPGGHAESGEREGGMVALREAHEETGIEGLVLHPSAPRPLDVDVHPIPARGDEPAHRHLDLRYLVVAPPYGTARLAAEEARALRWFTWADLSAIDLDPGLRRALRAARAFTSTRRAEEESVR
jgi:8-oxo-dGTP pyrophosphatase MutT (NUDIX family)